MRSKADETLVIVETLICPFKNGIVVSHFFFENGCIICRCGVFASYGE